MDDAELVEAALAGDTAVWGVVYDRYADKLHDYCRRILRDSHEASDALHDAFIAASSHLDSLRDPDRLRPWLYAICRNECLRRARQRTRAVPTEDLGEMSADVDDVAEVGLADEAELAHLVWEAADGLNERDRALLDLNVRHGLDGEELAAAVGVKVNHVYVMVHRLRQRVERSLGALLVARQGREDCIDLQEVLSGWDGTFSPLWRKRIARHVESCEVCDETRERVASPLALLAAAPFVPPPSGLRDRILDGVATSAISGPPPWGPTDDGFPPVPGGPGRRALWVTSAAAFVVLALVAGVIIAGNGGEGEELAAVESITTSTTAATTTTATDTTTTTAGSTSTTEDSTTSSSSSSTSVAPGALSLSGSMIDLGATATIGLVDLTNTGAQPITVAVPDPGPLWTPDQAELTLEPGAVAQVRIAFARADAPAGQHATTVTFMPSTGPAQQLQITALVHSPPVIEAVRIVPGGLHRPCTSRNPTGEVVAQVSSEAPLDRVVARVTGPDGSTSVLPMTSEGGSWVATLGPYGQDGPASLKVEATNEDGKLTRSDARQFDVVCYT